MNYASLRKHIRDIIGYWKPAVDWKNGGIHYIMKDFGGGPDRRKNKCLLMHVRQLYDFSVGAQMGIPGCLRIARHLRDSLDRLFLNRLGLYDSFLEDTRWYSRKRVSAYDQFYTVVGLSRCSRAFGDRETYQKAVSLFFRAKKRFAAGADFVRRGIFTILEKKTGKLSWKSGNSHLHLYEALVNLGLAAKELYCCGQFEKEMSRLLPVFGECHRLIAERIFNREFNATLEDFDDDLTISMEQRYGNVTNAHSLEWIGFMIETEWLTGMRIPFLRHPGRRLLDVSFKRAYDPSGAFRNDYYLQEDLSADGTSFWAQVESTLTACYAAKYYGSAGYLGKARKLWDFYRARFRDRKFGGMFSAVSSAGIALDRRKGHAYKCDHHNLRMCEKIIAYRLLDR